MCNLYTVPSEPVVKLHTKTVKPFSGSDSAGKKRKGAVSTAPLRFSVRLRGNLESALLP